MDTIFSTMSFRRHSTPAKPFSSCGDLQELYSSNKKRKNSKVIPASRYSPPSQSPLTNVHSMDRAKSRSNDELVNDVDCQLTQIREKLAMMREQDSQFRERMDSLSNSVSELSSRSSLSSFTSSECSDLGSLDEVSEEEECEEELTIGQRTFSNERLLRIPTIRGRPQFSRLPVKCLHTRQSSDPSSMYSHPELPEENAEANETQRHSTYSADQAMCLYPQYNNAEEISTMFWGHDYYKKDIVLWGHSAEDWWTIQKIFNTFVIQLVWMLFQDNSSTMCIFLINSVHFFTDHHL